MNYRVISLSVLMFGMSVVPAFAATISPNPAASTDLVSIACSGSNSIYWFSSSTGTQIADNSCDTFPQNTFDFATILGSGGCYDVVEVSAGSCTGMDYATCSAVGGAILSQSDSMEGACGFSGGGGGGGSPSGMVSTLSVGFVSSVGGLVSDNLPAVLLFTAGVVVWFLVRKYVFSVSRRV